MLELNSIEFVRKEKKGEEAMANIILSSSFKENDKLPPMDYNSEGSLT